MLSSKNTCWTLSMPISSFPAVLTSLFQCHQAKSSLRMWDLLRTSCSWNQLCRFTYPCTDFQPCFLRKARPLRVSSAAAERLHWSHSPSQFPLVAAPSISTGPSASRYMVWVPSSPRRRSGTPGLVPSMGPTPSSRWL